MPNAAAYFLSVLKLGECLPVARALSNLAIAGDGYPYALRFMLETTPLAFWQQESRQELRTLRD